MKQLRDLIRRWLGTASGRRVLAGTAGAAAMLLCGVASGSGAGHVWSIFKNHDINNSAALERNELPPVFEALHEPVTEAELDQVLATIDHDNNGAVEFEELVHWTERPNYWTWSSHKPPTGWFWIDFVIFVVAMVYFVRKPVQDAFKKRHDTIKKNLDAAQATHEKALAHREEYRDKLARVEEEAKKLVSGAKEDGATIRERIIEASKTYADRLRIDSDAAVGQEEQQARWRLRQEIAYEILREAAGTLETEIAAQDQQRLIEQTITDVEQGTGELARVLETVGGAP